MSGLMHAHSGFRWILLLMLIFTIINAAKKWKSDADFKAKDKIMAVITLALAHTVGLIGIVLYFTSAKVGSMSFYTFIHPLGMILALTFITIGYSRAKKLKSSRPKFRKILVWYTIGLGLIIVSIPWPFIIKGAGWA